LTSFFTKTVENRNQISNLEGRKDFIVVGIGCLL